jgi:hypothetical protein
VFHQVRYIKKPVSNFLFCCVLRLYPPGGFVNFVQQNYQPMPQQQGENFHLVGQNLSFNPMSTPPPQANPIVNIEEDEDENSGANVAGKVNQKRYWTHEEEERLVQPLNNCLFCTYMFC